MLQTEREPERVCHTCVDGIKSIENHLNAHMHKMNEKIDLVIKEREKTERKRIERLLETVSEHINKNIAPLFESIIQKEIRTHVLPQIEKGLEIKIGQKIQEMPSLCMQTISSVLEGKPMQHTLSKVLKQKVFDAVVPVVENGMCEIRLQVLEKIKEIVVPSNTVSVCREVEEKVLISADSQEETLDNIGDTLHIDDEPATEKSDMYKMVTHLLRTDISKCFFYVLNSGDPDIFLFLIDQMPIEIDLDLPAEALISFIYQLISFTGLGTKRCSSSDKKAKYTLFLTKALANIQGATLRGKEIHMLQKTFAYMQRQIQSKFFGNTAEEQTVLSLIESIRNSRF